MFDEPAIFWSNVYSRSSVAMAAWSAMSTSPSSVQPARMVAVFGEWNVLNTSNLTVGLKVGTATSCARSVSAMKPSPAFMASASPSLRHSGCGPTNSTLHSTTDAPKDSEYCARVTSRTGTIFVFQKSSYEYDSTYGLPIESRTEVHRAWSIGETKQR